MTATLEVPSIEGLSVEQKQLLLALLVKDEFDRVPVPRMMPIRHEGKEIAQLHYKWNPPAKATPYPFTPTELDEIADRMQNPGPTLTLEELRVLAKSGDDALLSR